jgi:hypothetical protein
LEKEHAKKQREKDMAAQCMFVDMQLMPRRKRDRLILDLAGQRDLKRAAKLKGVRFRPFVKWLRGMGPEPVARLRQRSRQRDVASSKGKKRPGLKMVRKGEGA